MSIFVLMAALASSPSEPPIVLETRPVSGGVEVRVVGRSEAPVSASYRLEVSSGDSGNRSTQAGQVRLQPDREHVLINLRMATGSSSNWSVRLRVEPEGHKPYEEVRSGGPEQVTPAQMS